jgi:hypothetical protein
MAKSSSCGTSPTTTVMALHLPSPTLVQLLMIISIILSVLFLLFLLFLLFKVHLIYSPLLISTTVPKDGKVCFWLDKTQFAEFENSFTYTTVNAMSAVGDMQMVMVVNYNVQACPGIPNLSALGFSTVPVSPEVSITLDNLQIKFKVTMAYVCNHTAWCMFLFFPHCCCHCPRLNAHLTALFCCLTQSLTSSTSTVWLVVILPVAWAVHAATTPPPPSLALTFLSGTAPLVAVMPCLELNCGVTMHRWNSQP